MTNWKLGTGTDYSSLTGFEFPSDEHPDNFSVEIVKAQETTPHYLRESVIVLDKGIKEARIVLDGKFFSDTNIRNFQKQVNKSEFYYNSDGWEEKNMYFEQRLYISDSRFYYVKTGSVQELKEGRRPGSRPYRATFEMVDPFQYSDSPEEDTISGSSGTTSSMDADGDIYLLPEFEFEVTSGNLTKIEITCNKSSGTIVVPCNISSGDTLKINQRQGIAQAYDSSGKLSGQAIGISGRIAIPETETGVTFTFTATGGSGDFTARLRPRYN